MSKEGSFRPKSRSGGKSFGDKPRGKFGGGKSFGGGRKDFGGKPRGKFGGEERGSFGDRDDRPRKSFGDKPFKKREFGDRDDRPRKSFGDKPFKKREFGDRDDRPRKSFGDKPFKKREFGDRDDRPRKSFGDKPFKKREFGDRDDRPRKSFGDKPFKKREFGDRDDRPRKSFGDKPFKKREFGDRDDRPRKSFGDKPFKKADRDGDRDAFLKRKYDGKPQKSYERYDEAPKKDFGARLKSDRPSYGAPSSAYLYGLHPVTEALLNPKRLHQRLICTEKGFESLREAWREAEEANISLPEVVYAEKEDIERLLPRDAVHQDVLLDCQPLEETFLVDALNGAKEDAVILVLDQVTDPHNVGAILRSAAAFGAIAVVVQKLHAPDITGTLAKSASGAVEHVPLVREVNLSRTLEELKEAGFFCIGLAEEGKATLAGLKLTGKTVLVLGAEGSGLRRLVAENCDDLARLPTQGPIGSLNVSNAAAVALYELVRAR